MITNYLADTVLLVSFLVSVTAYVSISKHEGSYLNILTPSFLLTIPSSYLLPWFFFRIFGTGATSYAFTYVYATIAAENVVFAWAYLRPPGKLLRLPSCYSYENFDFLAFASIGLALAMYAPILIEFPQYLADPRQIYTHTRIGFGINFFVSSTLAFVAVILIAFSNRSRKMKTVVVVAAAVILALHGSKGQLVTLAALILLFEVYVKGRKIKFWPSLLVGAVLSVFVLLLFAASMSLGESASDALESISEYSDYTRNAMLIIDSHYPLQYGRLTVASAIIGRIPRVLMPNKPRTFGFLKLDEEFYPEYVDAEAGAPDFGIGAQYADFGAFAIVYLCAFAYVNGWLARVFVSRVKISRHPADFIVLALAASVSLFPVGGVGWVLPETVALALLLRLCSCVGAKTVFRERLRTKLRPAPSVP